MIDELCALCGFERKYAIKVLGGKRRIEGKAAKKAGSAPKYGEVERGVLKEIWLAAEQPCGKRLKPALPLWLPHYEAEHGALDPQVRTKVLAVSPAAIDRLLKPCRVALGHKGRCGTRPGTLLRKEIPVRTEHWDVAGPGWVFKWLHESKLIESNPTTGLKIPKLKPQAAVRYNFCSAELRDQLLELPKNIQKDVLPADAARWISFVILLPTGTAADPYKRTPRISRRPGNGARRDSF